ncbi:hypothetical protein [Cohnella faecalis]|uniref:hypothetical protein n=1 Tax=Cohnella faecalis TaxID=2315694 RepID=UPI001F1DB4BC|nr:hypothetical protein [Cohnella faecalis]
MDDQNKKPEEWNEFPFGPSDRKEDNGFRQESEDSFAETRREPETYTYGPFGGTSAYSSSNDRLEPTSEQGQEPVEVVASSREYRPFTVSAEAEEAAAAGTEQSRKERRSAAFSRLSWSAS